MGARRFSARVAAGPRGRGVITIPFDPDAVWGAKAEHRVGGTIGGKYVRGMIIRDGDGWTFTVTPMWMRDACVTAGETVVIELAAEGPQRDDLADDLRAALEANPAAAAFYDTLAQFYRKAYLRWIDATLRRPQLRAARITEVVGLLAAGIKERPRPQNRGQPDGELPVAYGPGNWLAEESGVTGQNDFSPGTLSISDGTGTPPVTVSNVSAFTWAP
jgi:Bacteriocin-protection, YdeI or OmpD-Associated/Domain of unknown function (DUF1905)